MNEVCGGSIKQRLFRLCLAAVILACPAYAGKIEVEVSSRSDWVDTGVCVSKDLGVSIRYLSGGWNCDDRSFGKVDADGHLNEKELQYHPEEENSVVLGHFGDFKSLKAAPFGSLIASFENGANPMFVGNQQDLLGEEGQLWLKINDQSLTDNQGSILVEITTPAEIVASKLLRRVQELPFGRMKTKDESWKRHCEYDEFLYDQIARVLKGDKKAIGKARVVSIADLPELTTYPFLICSGAQRLSSASEKNNFREYLDRGGFVLIDECFNPRLVGDPEEWLRNENRAFSEIIPDAEIKAIPKEHEIFHLFFHFQEGMPQAIFQNLHSRRKAQLYGVYRKKLLIALFSTAGLQCGWVQCGPKELLNDRSRMVMNIYLYAMTR